MPKPDPSCHRLALRPSTLVAALGIGALGGYAFARWHRRWGATAGEAGELLPGDELVPRAGYQTTRAVTIHATPEEIWPWLVQIGQGRGGFYSYAWLENLVGAQIQNADAILSEHQRLEPGDPIRLAPDDSHGGRAKMLVAGIIDRRALVLVPHPDVAGAADGEDHELVWSFVLEPQDPHTTRLLARTRVARLATAPFSFLYDPIHFVMERKMLLGLKERVEGSTTVH